MHGAPLEFQQRECECQRCPCQRMVAVEKHLMTHMQSANTSLDMKRVPHLYSHTYRCVIYTTHNCCLAIDELHHHAFSQATSRGEFSLQAGNLLMVSRHRKQQRLVVFTCHTTCHARVCLPSQARTYERAGLKQ
jgi:hypothetical protein